MKKFLLFISIISSLLLASTAQATDFTMAPHPRLYLRAATNPPDLTGSAWLDTLRVRCAENKSLRHVYALTLAKAESELAGNAHGTYYLMPVVFAALIEDRSDLRTYAIDTIIAHKADVTTTGSSTVGDVSNVLLAYDWMYEYMTQAQRDEVGSIIGTALATTYNDNLTRYPWIPLTMHEMLQMIAVYGDTAAAGTYYCTDQDPNFASLREKVTYTDTETGTSRGYLTALDVVSSKGAITGYGAVRYAAMILNIEALHSSLGEDWVTGSSFLKNIGTYWVHLMRSDNIYPRTVGKFNPYMGQYLYMTWAGNMASDPYANWYATDILKEDDGDGSGVGLYNEWIAREVWMIMLWHTPWKTKTQFPSDLYYYDPGQEVVLARDRWERSALPASTSDTTTVSTFQFFGGINTSGTVASNHFNLTRGNDPILMASGGYVDTDLDMNFFPWYSTSQGWNCMKIGIGNEAFGSTAAAGGNQITCLAGAFAHPSSRMQWLIGYEENGANYSCDDSTAIYNSNMWAYQGKINEVVNTDNYIYIRADNTAAYTKDCAVYSASSVKREVVWIRREIKGVSILVVRESVLPKALLSITSTAVLHVFNRPLPVGGDVTKVAGADWATTGDPGGSYTTTSRTISIPSGTSKGILYCLTPGSGAGTVRMIGGANSAGAYWKQNAVAGCDNYSALDPSFEFYSTVSGKNYIGAGDPAVSRRSDSAIGEEAADWRLEIEPAASAVAQEILYVIVSGSSAMASPTVTVATAGGVETVTVIDGLVQHKIKFAETGFFTGCTRSEPCGLIY